MQDANMSPTQGTGPFDGHNSNRTGAMLAHLHGISTKGAGDAPVGWKFDGALPVFRTDVTESVRLTKAEASKILAACLVGARSAPFMNAKTITRTLENDIGVALGNRYTLSKGKNEGTVVSLFGHALNQAIRNMKADAKAVAYEADLAVATIVYVATNDPNRKPWINYGQAINAACRGIHKASGRTGTWFADPAIKGAYKAEAVALVETVETGNVPAPAPAPANVETAPSSTGVANFSEAEAASVARMVMDGLTPAQAAEAIHTLRNL